MWCPLQEGPITQWAGSACASHASAPGSRSVVGEACGDLFLALQQWRLRISRDSRDHVTGGAVLLTLSRT